MRRQRIAGNLGAPVRHLMFALIRHCIAMQLLLEGRFLYGRHSSPQELTARFDEIAVPDHRKSAA